MNNVLLQKIKSDEKYNPDVLKKHNLAMNNYNKPINFEFTNEYYKSVTNLPITSKIKSPDDMKLQKDFPDNQKLSIDFNDAIRLREIETDIVNKSKEEYNKKYNIKSAAEIDRDYLQRQKQDETRIAEMENAKNNSYYPNLKKEFQQYNIKAYDKLKQYKEKFNDILSGLDNLL